MESQPVVQIGSLPFFITGPGETDILLTGMIVFTLLAVLLIGVFYFYLHSLPERMAHRTNSAQLQLVGILALLALFTHNNIFWVAALLIVAIRLPDFVTPINSIAGSLKRMAEGPAPANAERAPPAEPPADPTGEAKSVEAPSVEAETTKAASAKAPPDAPTRRGDNDV